MSTWTGILKKAFSWGDFRIKLLLSRSASSDTSGGAFITRPYDSDDWYIEVLRRDGRRKEQAEIELENVKKDKVFETLRRNGLGDLVALVEVEMGKLQKKAEKLSEIEVPSPWRL